MRLLIAGGGTGGHIYPALAVARSLRARAGAPELGWLGGHRGLEAEIVPSAGIPLRRLLLRSLRSAGRDIHLLLDPVRLALSVPEAFVLLIARRPAAIFTTGGYVAIPVLLAAAVLRIPSVLWDGNVVPGRSVRLVARLATVVAVSHAATGDTLARPRTYVTGTPIRSLADVDVDEARERFGSRPGERVLLVFGGSQAVRRINDAVTAALPRLVERVRVVHVTGDAGYAAAVAAREALPAELRDRYRPAPFLHGDDMTLALAAADLAVGRAGASTLAEAAAFALPTVIVPYPHAAGHQRLNAEAFSDVGAAVLIEDEDLDADRLVEAAGLLADPARHAGMSAAARDLARPDAAVAVADLVMAAALREELPTAATIDATARGRRP
ncbi:MAG TPA: UDP-N-acetylglucosamine--N-acetylmuramyl-(pentapeptide) pyrophosphoryl-undecaprenol N-acetylglucosamine transferase [Candidatus Limnocylindrales bacterium]|nr:UDP-N-acetylglucosamine--N-acetylmuramyl-(pentapeptide) pyrophosphoryl-undecaprenol N-acetylglucosamine transferase [Candidatus Limnocylindrales bacterium]